MINLRNLRINKKITQSDLAELLGFTQKIISDYENGRSEPSIEALIKFSDFFHCSIDYLVGRESSTMIDLVRVSLEKRELIELIKELDDLESSFVKGYAKRILEEREERIKENTRLRKNSKF